MGTQETKPRKERTKMRQETFNKIAFSLGTTLLLFGYIAIYKEPSYTLCWGVGAITMLWVDHDGFKMILTMPVIRLLIEDKKRRTR